MRFVISVGIVPEDGQELDRSSVAKDLQLYLMDFAQAEKSNDVIGGFHITGASTRELW